MPFGLVIKACIEYKSLRKLEIITPYQTEYRLVGTDHTLMRFYFNPLLGELATQLRRPETDFR